MSAAATFRLSWPLPALLGWGGAWAACWLVALAAPAAALPSGVAVGALAALTVGSRWRRAIVAGGFPLSALALGLGTELPPWVWLLPLALLALAYPMRAWRDAPLFPTPRGALDALAQLIVLAPGARVLDAGCGTGAGLRALARAWPQARLEGVEWSWPLSWLARWRCRDATVRRGDLWRTDWRGLDLVYLFQRPESMARALAKARTEMAGGWLVSLEFECAGEPAHAVLSTPDGRPLWVYRVGAAAPGSTTAPARR